MVQLKGICSEQKIFVNVVKRQRLYLKKYRGALPGFCLNRGKACPEVKTSFRVREDNRVPSLRIGHHLLVGDP